MPRKIKHDPLVDPDWKKQADQLRAEAQKLPYGRERDALLRKARHLDTASHMKDWLTSPGLLPPKKEVP